MDQLHRAPTYAGFARSPTKLFDQPKATRIRVYRNGDSFSPARKIVVQQRGMSLERFLDLMSDEMRSYGAIRRLYTPNTGTAITSVDQIHDGCSIVVSRREKFKKLNYSKIVHLRDREIAYRQQQAARPPKARSPVKVLPRRHYISMEKPKNVVFLRNGDKTGTQFRVLLTKRNTMSWDQMCQMLSDKLKMETAVRKLFTLSGEQVSSFDELQNGGSYVAVARKPFVSLGYTPAPPMRSRTTLTKKPVLPSISPAKARVKPRPRPPAGTRATAPDHATGRRSKPTIVKSPSLSASSREQVAASVSPVPLLRERTSLVADPRVISRVGPVVQPQSYMIKVYTANEDGAGTDAKVYITIIGTEGQSPRLPLSDKPGRFQQGTCDIIAVQAEPLGALKEVRIEHDNSGPSSSWKLVKVTIRDALSNKLSYFHCHKWLADDRGDFSTMATLPASDTDLTAQSVKPKMQNSKVDNTTDTVFAATEIREHADDVSDTEETKVDEVVDHIPAEEVEEVEAHALAVDHSENATDGDSNADVGHDAESAAEQLSNANINNSPISADLDEPISSHENSPSCTDEAHVPVDSSEYHAAGDGAKLNDEHVQPTTPAFVSPANVEVSGIEHDVSDEAPPRETSPDGDLNISADIQDNVASTHEAGTHNGMEDDSQMDHSTTVDEELPSTPISSNSNALPASSSSSSGTIEQESGMENEERHIATTEDGPVPETNQEVEVRTQDVGELDTVSISEQPVHNGDHTTTTGDTIGTIVHNSADTDDEASVHASQSNLSTEQSNDHQTQDALGPRENSLAMDMSDQELPSTAGSIATNSTEATVKTDTQTITRGTEEPKSELTEAEEQLLETIADIEHNKLCNAFSTADDGTPVARVSVLASAISGLVIELGSADDLNAAVQGNSEEHPVVEGYAEAQLLLASAFYLKRLKQSTAVDNEGRCDLVAFKAVCESYSMTETESDMTAIFTDFELQRNAASALEVAVWLANKRIISCLK